MTFSQQQTAAHLKKELRRMADPARAIASQRYFKTGPGEYAEGDRFIGVTVPQTRRVCRGFSQLPIGEIKKLLQSKIHEDRLAALIILVNQHAKADAAQKQKLFELYFSQRTHINNWDLVDTSAPAVVGEYASHAPKDFLETLARSTDLWERRIAILATFYSIRQNQMSPSLRIAKILLNDEHDLIHKAVGWMLREVGKRSPAEEERFLAEYAHRMPRTMLRYAVERFPEQKRLRYLKGSS